MTRGQFASDIVLLFKLHPPLTVRVVVVVDSHILGQMYDITYNEGGHDGRESYSRADVWYLVRQ